MKPVERTFYVFGGSGSAPSFTPHATAEHIKGLFICTSIHIIVGVVYEMIVDNANQFVYNTSTCNKYNMGMRKKINAIVAKQRVAAKKHRDKNKLKRAAKPATAGQTLHAKMHGRSDEKKAA